MGTFETDVLSDSVPIYKKKNYRRCRYLVYLVIQNLTVGERKCLVYVHICDRSKVVVVGGGVLVVVAVVVVETHTHT